MSTDNAASGDNQANSVPLENPSTDKVAYDTYRRVLSEAKKLKDELRAIKEQEQKSHETKLKEQNEWKALAEAKASQAEQLEKLYKEQQEQIVNGMKFQEFEKHLGGRLKDRDYATFIDFDKIVINPETKSIDEESVKGVVSNFVKKHSHLVEFQGSAKMPNVAANSGSNFASKSLDKMDPKELADFIIEQGKLGKIK